MANKFQIKRTSVSGRTPNTTNSGNTHFIDTGELALNLTDGKLFSSNGTTSFEVGANLSNASVTNVLTVKAISANGSNGTAGQVLTSNGTSSYWSTVSSGGGFTNGTSISVDDLEITGSLTANSSTGSNGQILFSNGTGVYWSDPNTGSGTFVTRTYTGDGACTQFTVTTGVTNSSSLVMENGIVQTPSSDYTVSGNTLTFTTAPANGINIQIREIGLNFDANSSYTANNLTAKSTLVIGNTSVNTVILASLTASRTVTIPDESFTIGFRNIPPVGTKTGSYTLAAADVGKYVQIGSGGSITIPDGVFSEGDAVNIINNTSANATITCSITTAYIAGTDTDKASMTLATRGMATILFLSSTVCVVVGNIT